MNMKSFLNGVIYRFILKIMKYQYLSYYKRGKEIFDAMKHSDIAGLRNYLKDGGNLNVYIDNDPDIKYMYTTFLNTAILEGNIKMVKFLLEEAKMDPNNLSRDIPTPLYCAMYVKNTEMIKFLLDHGADPNLMDWHGYSPIDIATPETKDILIKGGAYNSKAHYAINNIMQIMEKEKNILARLHSTGEVATPKDLKTLNDKSYLLKIILPLILEVQANKTKKSEDNYQPFILDTPDKMKRFNIHMRDLIKNKKPFLFNCVYVKENLSSEYAQAIQIQYDGREAKILAADPASNIKNFKEIDELANIIKASIKKIFYKNSVDASYTDVLEELSALSNMTYKSEEKLLGAQNYSINVYNPANGQIERQNRSINDQMDKYIKEAYDQFHDKPELIEATIAKRTNFLPEFNSLANMSVVSNKAVPAENHSHDVAPSEKIAPSDTPFSDSLRNRRGRAGSFGISW